MNKTTNSNGEQPIVIVSFEKRGDYTYRTSAYIQWGDSEKSIGSFLLLNPGGATFSKEDAQSEYQLQRNGQASGLVTADRTMRQLIKFIHEVYGTNNLDGRCHIYNLFSLRNPDGNNAIDTFEALSCSGKYDALADIPDKSVLAEHPWILLGWGINAKPQRVYLAKAKTAWRDAFTAAGIHSFGKKQTKGKGTEKNVTDYYHVCPQLSTDHPKMIEDLVSIFRDTVSVAN